MGSDGVFDVLTNRTIAKITGKMNAAAPKVCNELIKELRKRPGTDEKLIADPSEKVVLLALCTLACVVRALLQRSRKRSEQVQVQQRKAVPRCSWQRGSKQYACFLSHCARARLDPGTSGLTPRPSPFP